MKPSLHWSRRRTLSRLGAVLILGALSGAIFWLHDSIQDARRRIEQARLASEDEVTGAVTVAALSQELKDRQGALALLHSYVPESSGIGDAVSLLEREASQRSLTLSIPAVKEITEDQGGETGQITRRVALSLNVTGEEQAIWQFLHAVEHLPYLSQVAAWRFNIKEGLDKPPVPAGQTLEPGLETAAGPRASLTVEMVLTVLNDSYDAS